MKKLTLIFLATILIGMVSCTKSDDDPPVTITDYTIKYSVISTGNVVMDTIKYMDVDGVEKYKIGEANFEHSFVQPSTNYHGKIYISGTIEDGSCNYLLTVEDKDGGIIEIKENGGSSTSSSSFKWWAEFNHVED
jgi:hypothetical protein